MCATDMKHVLVACSGRGRSGANRATNFSRYGGAEAVARTLQRYGMQVGGDQTRFVFVNPIGPANHEHVRDNLLTYLQTYLQRRSRSAEAASRATTHKFDAILLMGCNSITWLLEHANGRGVYAPGDARSILHDALAPGGLLLVFERGEVGGTFGLQDMHAITRVRFQRGVHLDGPEALDHIDAVFAPTHWTKLGPGVYKRRSVRSNTAASTARQRPPVGVSRTRTATGRASMAAAAGRRRRLDDY